MDYFSKGLSSLSSLFSSKIKSAKPVREIKHYGLLEYFFKVISWKDPYLSWCCFLIMNLTFWFMIEYEIKPIGMMFLFIFILFINDSLFSNNKSSDSSEISFSEEIERCYCMSNSIVLAMTGLRKENPATFCLVMSMFFLGLIFIASNISGILLFYIILLAIFFIPLGYSVLPPEHKNTIEKIIKTILTYQDNIIAEDELIPLQVRFKIDDDEGDLESLDTDKSPESVSNSLISGISSMPSYMDQEENEILEEDLLPSNFNSQGKSSNITDLSSDSDSEYKEMNFRETHFKDSSSDEGSKFEEGLHFSEDTTDSTLKNESNQLVKGVMNYIFSSSAKANVQGLLNAVNLTGNNTNDNSSSDSEFEMINTEDLQNE